MRSPKKDPVAPAIPATAAPPAKIEAAVLISFSILVGAGSLVVKASSGVLAIPATATSPVKAVSCIVVSFSRLVLAASFTVLVSLSTSTKGLLPATWITCDFASCNHLLSAVT